MKKVYNFYNLSPAVGEAKPRTNADYIASLTKHLNPHVSDEELKALMNAKAEAGSEEDIAPLTLEPTALTKLLDTIDDEDFAARVR